MRVQIADAKRMVGREVITRLLSFLGAPVCWVPVSDLLNAGQTTGNPAFTLLFATYQIHSQVRY